MSINNDVISSKAWYGIKASSDVAAAYQKNENSKLNVASAGDMKMKKSNKMKTSKEENERHHENNLAKAKQ